MKLIDFDDCGTGPRLYELAVALWELRDEEGYAAFRDALLDGYRRAPGYRRPAPGRLHRGAADRLRPLVHRHGPGQSGVRRQARPGPPLVAARCSTRWRHHRAKSDQVLGQGTGAIDVRLDQPDDEPLPPVGATDHVERLDDPGARPDRLEGDGPLGAVDEPPGRDGPPGDDVWRIDAQHLTCPAPPPGPVRLRPRNRAPGAADVEPSSQTTWRHSWLHSPVRVGSETTRHTDSTGAVTVSSTRQERATWRFMTIGPDEGSACR